MVRAQKVRLKSRADVRCTSTCTFEHWDVALETVTGKLILGLRDQGVIQAIAAGYYDPADPLRSLYRYAESLRLISWLH